MVRLAVVPTDQICCDVSLLLTLADDADPSLDMHGWSGLSVSSLNVVSGLRAVKDTLNRFPSGHFRIYTRRPAGNRSCIY